MPTPQSRESLPVSRTRKPNAQTHPIFTAISDGVDLALVTPEGDLQVIQTRTRSSVQITKDSNPNAQGNPIYTAISDGTNLANVNSFGELKTVTEANRSSVKVHGDQGLATQRPGSLDLYTQLRHAGIEYDARQIRALDPSIDGVTAKQGNAGTAAQGWYVRITDGTDVAEVTAAGSLNINIADQSRVPIAVGPNLTGLNSPTNPFWTGLTDGTTSVAVESSTQALRVNQAAGSSIRITDGTHHVAVGIEGEAYAATDGGLALVGYDGSAWRILRSTTQGSLKIDGRVTADQGNAGTAAEGWYARITDGVDVAQISTVGAHKALKVDVVQTVGGVTDKFTWIEGISGLVGIGAVFSEVAVADPIEDQYVNLRSTVKRALHVNLRDAGGTELGSLTSPVMVSLRSNDGTADILPKTLQVNGSGSALNAVLIGPIDVSNYRGVTLRTSGTFSATIQWEVSWDGGTTWDNLTLQQLDSNTSGYQTNTGSSSVDYGGQLPGGLFRVRLSAYTSGTATVHAAFTAQPFVASISPDVNRQTDRSSFTDGSGRGHVIMGVRNDTITTDPSEDQAAAIRITPKRAQHVNLRNDSGTELGTQANPFITRGGSTNKHANGGPITVPAGGTDTIVEVTASTGDILQGYVASGDRDARFYVTVNGATLYPQRIASGPSPNAQVLLPNGYTLQAGDVVRLRVDNESQPAYGGGGGNYEGTLVIT